MRSSNVLNSNKKCLLYQGIFAMRRTLKALHDQVLRVADTRLLRRPDIKQRVELGWRKVGHQS